jgi:IclR family KDG regulon transcriptional repressor
MVFHIVGHRSQEMPLNSIQKALHIIMAFSAERPLWGVRELSARLGFSPSTVQRILVTLKEYAFVDQDTETRQYRLGNVYFQILHVLQSTYPVARMARAFMKDLASRTLETVYLNVIDGFERLCVDSIESPQRVRASMPIGERSPLHAGASAKCLLAFSSQDFIDKYLNEVRLVPLTERTTVDPDVLRRQFRSYQQQGYASTLGERTPGLAVISAPVLDHSGMLVASISLALPELRYHDKEHWEHCREILLEITASLSRTFGYFGPDPSPISK